MQWMYTGRLIQFPAALLAAVVTGAASNYIQTHVLMTVAFVLAGLGTLLYPFIAWLWMLVVAFLLTGVAFGARCFLVFIVSFI